MTKGARLSGELTLRERGYAVCDGGKRIGAVIRNSNGAFVAWAPGRLGEYCSPHEAESAIRGEAKKKRR
jgi:hypothetical protein